MVCKDFSKKKNTGKESVNETSTPVSVRKKFWSFFAQAGVRGAVNDKDHNKPLDLWSEAYLVLGHIPGNGSDSTGTTPL